MKRGIRCSAVDIVQTQGIPIRKNNRKWGRGNEGTESQINREENLRNIKHLSRKGVSTCSFK